MAENVTLCGEKERMAREKIFEIVCEESLPPRIYRIERKGGSLC